jgi:hypothetical protein
LAGFSAQTGGHAAEPRIGPDERRRSPGRPLLFFRGAGSSACTVEESIMLAFLNAIFGGGFDATEVTWG